MAIQSKDTFVEYIVETGEIVKRDFTAVEAQQLKEVQDNALLKKEEAVQKELAKAELLTKLGITQEEANLLLG
jgi:hypothetical protein